MSALNAVLGEKKVTITSAVIWYMLYPPSTLCVSDVSTNLHPDDYMVRLRQEQNPIMKFAVPFLKMLAFSMLWRAQILSDFYAVFCVLVTTLS